MRFSDIQGCEEIKRKLIQTVLDQRVSHAQLFFGPEGSGKLALAIAYAQLINCTNRQPAEAGINRAFSINFDSCGICPSCIKYQKLIHPDLHFIFPVATTRRVQKKPQSKLFIEDWRKFLIGNNYQATLQGWYETIDIENKQGIINAEDCNEIISTLGYKSYESEYKVMIIWMAEKLYYSAAPKILKILEEPPEKTLFLLISDEPGLIIPTILSRTLLVKIPSDTEQTCESREEEKVHFESFRQWMLWCFAGQILELVKFAGEMAKSGREKEKSFLLYGLHIFGFCASYNAGLLTRVISEGKELEFIKKFSGFITLENVAEFSNLFNTAVYHIERNAHGPTLFLDLSLNMVRLFKPNFVPL